MLKNNICCKSKFIAVIITSTLLFLSCKKLVEVGSPFYSTNAQNVFREDASAIAALTGIYTDMSRSSIFSGSGSINMMAGLSADELTLFKDVSDVKFNSYYTNALVSVGPTQNFGTDAWDVLYKYVYYCNAAIEGLTLNDGNKLTPAIKQQLLGEAKFLRAFFYYYLVNLFGDVPLCITTDASVNATLSRMPKNDIYRQIISDLQSSNQLLSEDFLSGTLLNTSTERVRPTKWASKALLARVCLHAGDFVNAESESSDIIMHNSVFSLTSLGNVFLKASAANKEPIWQLQPVTAGRNTGEARTFLLTSSGPTTNTDRPVHLSPQLMGSFEMGDQRRTKWMDSVTVSGIKYFYPSKYKNDGATVTEYLMVFRLAEQYLIRAEARAMQAKFQQAIDDVNLIRFVHGGLLVSQLAPSNQSDAINAVLRERQVELFTEWAHRWCDIKRTGKVDEVMGSVTPVKSNGTINWQSYKQLYPIPYTDVEKNSNLTQNSGY